MEYIKDNKAECFGCGACVSVCPKQIVTMRRDDEGFAYSVFDAQQCIHCNLCRSVCPALQEPESPFERRFFALRFRGPEERRESTSGGAFMILARAVLRSGGVIVGAAYQEGFRVEHEIARTEDDLQRLRKSKYVQSSITHLYAQIEEALRERSVLFTGTPCQCDALRRFLIYKKVNQDRLILCDLVCGKSTSPQVWEEYVAYLEETFGGKLTRFTCRDKRYGWNYHKSSAMIRGKDVSEQIERKYSWMALFSQASFSRPSCYTCPFATVRRNTDLTIGDLWGVERVRPEFADNTGVNVVIVQSEKGLKLLTPAVSRSDVVMVELQEKDILQERLRFPLPQPEDRDILWEVYHREGIGGLLKHYGKQGVLKRIIYGKIIPWSRKNGMYDVLWRMTHHRNRAST